MATRFEIGRGYRATHTLTGAEATLVARLSVGGRVAFERGCDFGRTVTVLRMDGREFAAVAFRDGVYGVSSAMAAGEI